MFLNEKITEFREEKGLSKTALMFELDKVGFRVSRQTLINWESGKTFPNAQELSKLATFFGKKVSQFFKEG
ncbi:MAG: helix-turn-helix transcriptional regulator [Candidatus Margulisiibacteriota bacterium]